MQGNSLQQKSSADTQSKELKVPAHVTQHDVGFCMRHVNPPRPTHTHRFISYTIYVISMEMSVDIII